MALDSLEAIANSPGDTVYIDTTEERIIIKWLDPEVPESLSVGTELNFYRDTVTTEDLSIWAELWIRGELQDWTLRGETMVRQIEMIIEVPKPVVVSNNIEVQVIERGLFLAVMCSLN